MKKHHLIISVFITLLVTSSSFSQSNPCCDFNDTGQYPGSDGETFGVSLGDIDNDGDADAVVVDAYDDMEVYLNDGTGTFTYDQTYGASKSWFGVYLIDVDMDNDLDIIVSGFYSGTGCEVWKNNGSGSFTFAQGSIATSIAMQELAIGDVNGDGTPDIFAPAYSGGGSQVWLNDSSGVFTNTNQSLTGSSCTQAVLADLDGDNDLDAFISRTNGSPNTVWLNNGSGFFNDTQQALGSAFSNGVDAADIDDDGDIDVVASNWQVPSQIWLNDGNATFTAGLQINNDNYAKSIVFSDIDHDCDDDFIIGSYGSNGVQVWTNDGLGVFNLCYENDNGNSVYAHDIAVADLNNDLMPDIWAGNFSSSSGDHIFLQATPVITYDTLGFCQGDSVFVGCEWQFSTGDFLEAINCDTLTWYHISETTIDTTITQNNDTLFALPNYTAYQWFDCETMIAVNGANNYYFTSELSGSFAVEITEQTCVDTSSCHWIQIPNANFVGTPTVGEAPLLVVFTDLSIDSVTTWQWNFGDGNTSTLQNPEHEYITPGDYTVTLMITGPGGSDTLVKPEYVDVNYINPAADFIGTPTSGIAPLDVSFTDLSTDSIDTWVWDFGDGGSSFLPSPVYTYDTEGTYTVSLTVVGPGGIDEMEKTDYITVSAEAPVADFSGTPTSGEAPLLVSFSDLSSGSIATWDWDFGDGNISTEQNPAHEYLAPGNYTVSLTIVGSGGTDTEVKIDYILIPVGIEENAMEAILVYPNPVMNNLHIVFPDAKSRILSLKNMNGKKVFERNSNNKEEVIDLQKFAQGVYSLIIKTDDNVVSIIKVIKK